jgi:hypothetical protein
MSIILNPKRRAVKAMFIKSHLRMMSVGMKHSSLTMTEVLKQASMITDKKYKRTKAGCREAYEDVSLYLRAYLHENGRNGFLPQVSTSFNGI